VVNARALWQDARFPSGDHDAPFSSRCRLDDCRLHLRGCANCAAGTGPQLHKLAATPKTVAWGYYDAAAPPVLRIRSGDSVDLKL